MEVRKLYVGLSKSNPAKIGSVLIRWAESPKKLSDPRSWFSLYHSSHVFILFPKKPNRTFFMVQESAGPGIRWQSQFYFLDHARINKLYEFTLEKSVYDDVKAYGEQYAGAPYAFMENAGIAITRLFGIFGIKIKNPFPGGEALQKCSELVIRNVILRVLGMNPETLAYVVSFERGHIMPTDLDLMGVRDTEEALQMLCARGIVKEVSLNVLK